MIERKIAQLGEEDRALLTTASVQGHEFDSAVVARVLVRDPADVEERLEALDRIHRFVTLVDEREFPDRTLTVRTLKESRCLQDPTVGLAGLTAEAQRHRAEGIALEMRASSTSQQGAS
jgi:hypothetical protein